MKRKAKYICLEGTEGVGKTTQTKKLVESLRAQGYTVLQTKEPGVDLVPLTMTLRGIMLDNQYDQVLTRPAREFISQAIRSIHLERLIVPNLYEYDYIVQDRGILSGYAYGEACGNNFPFIYDMTVQNVDCANLDVIRPESIYDLVIYLKGNSVKNLQRAKTSKQEFETGDAMESRGDAFLDKVVKNMDKMSSRFKTVTIDVDGKSIEEVNGEIMTSLKQKDL